MTPSPKPRTVAAANAAELFENLPQQTATVAYKGRAYAAPPGSGPVGERCKTCMHYAAREWDKRYLKCGLMRAYWTKGTGTDIKASSAACAKWEQPTT